MPPETICVVEPIPGFEEPVKVTMPTVPSVLTTTVVPLGILPLATNSCVPDSTPDRFDPLPK